MSAKVLQLVNSSFFGLPHRVTSVTTAVTFLGLNMLKNLALSVEVFRAFEGKPESQGFSLDRFQKHGLLTAHLAKKMFKDKEKAEDAFIAGMLHDIGQLFMMAYFPAKFETICKEMKAQGKKRYVVETDLIGVTHAEVGLISGNLGHPLCCYGGGGPPSHPQRVPNSEFDLVSAVYVANRLVDLEDDPADELDPNYLKKLGVSDQVPIWQSWLQESKEQVDLEAK